MFNIFKSKPAPTRVTDKVTIDEKAKWQALFKLWQENKNTVFIFWFNESLEEAAAYFSSQTTEPVQLLTYREAAGPQAGGKIPIFAEHYPLRSKENELYEKMNLKGVQVYSSLKEPLFLQFGGERIVELMKKLGIKEDEVLEHAMISNAIKNAQEKIAKKISYEQSAQSQDDWFKRNLNQV
ncbi:MAG: hypothetical protein JNM88_17815 [Chitinophagaceae bacterium]|nr:hypothetical protein [Chitinophagaceae bacterium]